MDGMDDIERELRHNMKKVRPHASFFDGPNKGTKELGIVQDLLKTVGQPLEFRAVRRGPDPPDAVGERETEGLAAIEVTELVDQKVAAHNVQAMRQGRAGDVVQRVWDEASLVAAVEERLRVKDGVNLKGGPYGEYVVALHTDEATLTHAEAETWLRGHEFTGMRQITDAYLL